MLGLLRRDQRHAASVPGHGKFYCLIALCPSWHEAIEFVSDEVAHSIAYMTKERMPQHFLIAASQYEVCTHAPVYRNNPPPHRSTFPSPIHIHDHTSPRVYTYPSTLHTHPIPHTLHHNDNHLNHHHCTPSLALGIL
jgi:hypothetical protein